MASFNKNWRRKQELDSRILIDRIYKSVFGEEIDIIRFENAEGYTLDREFAIDAIITFPTGMIMTGQEKALSNKFAKYKSLTVEYMQNPTTEEKGDWFKLAVQYYFVGYLNKQNDRFDIWAITNWANIAMATQKNKIVWEDNKNTKDGARASFRYCRIDKLPDECIIASSL